DLAGRGARRRHALAHEDGAGSVVRRGHVVMREGKEDHGLPHFAVGQAHPARKPRLVVDHHAPHVPRAELLVAHAKERLELPGFERHEPERSAHDDAFLARGRARSPNTNDPTASSHPGTCHSRSSVFLLEGWARKKPMVMTTDAPT